LRVILVRGAEMNPDYFQLLFDYNTWANHRLLDACEALSPDQFTRDLHSSFPSVRDTLAHIAGGEWLYLERFRNRSPEKLPASNKYPDLASLRAKWTQIENDLSDLIAGLSQAGLDRVLEYRNTRGTPYSNPTSELLQHLANHSTYHRGQVTTMLRQLGAKAATLDLIYYFRDKPDAFPGARLDPDTLRLLYDYEGWASVRMFDACARLTPEEFSRDLGSSFPSVQATLTHICAAQWVWLERFHGRMPTAFPPELNNLGIEELRARNVDLTGGFQKFVGGCSSDSLQGPHEYHTFAGQTYSNPLWISLRHMVNHGTYHRGQVNTMLRQLGTETFSNDLTYFFRERAGLPLM
jgi:uncharacterized damage-inducible protein DinB